MSEYKDQVRGLLEMSLKSESELWRELVHPTYRIAENGESITCLLCGRTSHNLNDVTKKYCGNCNIFHAKKPTENPIRKAGKQDRE